MKKIIITILAVASMLTAQAQWTRVQNFIGGEPIGIAKKSFNTYVLSQDGKLYQSNNNVESWGYLGTIENTTTRTSYTGAKFFSNDNMLFCGTRNKLKRSISGSSWTDVSIDGTILANIGGTFGPKLVVATYTSFIDSASVYSSDDDGTSFSKHFTLKGEVFGIQTVNNKLYIITESKIHESINGVNFTNISTTGLPSLRNFSLGMAFTGDDNALYITTHSGLSSEVYKFASNVWVKSSTGLPANTHYSALSFVNNVLYISAYNAITKNGGMYASINNGQSWQKVIGNGLKSNYLRTISAIDDVTLLAGFDDGIYASSDKGASWFPKVDGYIGSIWREILNVNNTLITNDQFAGVYRSLDDGEIFLPRETGLEISQSITFYDIFSTQDAIFLTTTFGNSFSMCTFYKSTNYGKDWIQVDLPNKKTVYPYIMGSNDNTLFISLNDTYYKSTNEGETWIDITSGIPNPNDNRFAQIVGANGIAYLATSNEIFRSLDNGNSWLLDTIGLGLKDMRGPYYLGVVDGELTTIIPKDNFEPGSQIFRRAAEKWELVTSSTINNKVYKIKREGNYLYARMFSEKGIVVSANNGKTFTPFNNGFTLDQVETISDFEIINGSMVVVMNGRAGIWRNSQLTGTTQVHYLGTKDELLVYPNPVNSTLTIQLPNNNQTFTTQLFDLQGKLVKTSSSNTTQQQIDVTDLSDGMYVCKIITADKTLSSKIIISKQ